MKINRRGEVEIPVVAIFMIVAGAIIVLFFVVLVFNQGENATQETEARTLNFLDTLIRTSATAPETETNITIVDDTILFTCDEEGMRFGFESENALPLFDLVAFAPRKLEGGIVNAYSKGENIPFRAFNILYLTTPEYILQDGVGLSDKPTVIQTVPFTPGTPPEKGRRVVMTASALRQHYSQPGATVPTDLVTIDSPHSDLSYGTVTFYQRGSPFDASGAVNKVTYPTKNLLYGALLSRDKEMYNCVFNAYLRQLRYVAALQKARAETLKEQSSGGTCYPLYQTSALDTIINLPNAELFGFAEAQAYQNAMKELAFVNDNLLRGDNCVSLY